MALPSVSPHLLPPMEDPRELLTATERLRLQTNARLDPALRGQLGQFMTPAPVASLMASMIGDVPKELTILDAGAGVGSLTAAAIGELLDACPAAEVHPRHDI